VPEWDGQVAEYIAERRLPEALARYLRDWEG